MIVPYSRLHQGTADKAAATYQDHRENLSHPVTMKHVWAQFTRMCLRQMHPRVDLANSRWIPPPSVPRRPLTV